jgi:hypothetical protein
MKAAQVGQGTALVEEDQTLGRDGGRLAAPRRPRLLHLGLVLLGGAQASLFYASGRGA